MDDGDDIPLYLGLGACHELGAGGKRRPVRRREPIGFVHFAPPERTRPVPATRGLSKPQAKPRKRPR
jgi:hypothetical protein